MRGKLRFLIILGLLGYCFAFQGARGLWEPDEGRYTAVAMEMLRDGNWLQPSLHPEQPHWTKPPLTYWAIAASIAGLGRNEFAARFPSTLAFFLTTLLVYLLGRLFLAKRPWLAPLVYASFLLPAVASNIITTDGLLTLWETAALCAFAYATWGEKRSAASTWLVLMWAAFGIAFFTKGPPGLLPLAAIVAYRYWPGSGAPRLRWRTGLLVMLAVALPWFLLVVAKHPALIDYFLVHEVYGRVVTGEHSRNSQWYKAFVIYLPVLLLGTLPWTFWPVRAVSRAVRALRWPPKAPQDRSQGQELFLLLWVLLPLVVFMVSSSRLPLYLLPLFVPLALLAARGLEASSFVWTRWRVAGVVLWCLLLVALRLIAARVPTTKNAAPLARAIAALHVTPFSEVAFYGTDPVHSINLYLDKEVEDVSAATLDDELLEDEVTLWVVPPPIVPSFLQEAVRYGKDFQTVGSFGDRYVFLRERPPAR